MNKAVGEKNAKEECKGRVCHSAGLFAKWTSIRHETSLSEDSNSTSNRQGAFHPIRTSS